MREALASLTVRGRAFLAAGVTAVVCAVVLGQTALARVGVLVLVLPLLAAYLLARNRYRLSLTREVAPTLVAAGQAAEVSLALSNTGPAPGGVLLLEDQVPYPLGSRPRFVLDGIGRGWKHRVLYQVRSEVRGRFEIGPLRVRVDDPFGLVRLDRTFAATNPLVVTPRVVPLPDIRLGGAHSGAGDNRPRAFATGSAEDVTVREYRHGDDLRRVHWRATARAGELMVRREEQPWQSRATLFLDNRRSVHRGNGAASSLETAVVVAASVAAHLTQRGFDVRLVTAAGEDPGAAWHFHRTDLDTRPLLETLAVVESIRSTNIDTGWLGEQGHGGLLVAVLGEVLEHDLPVLRRMQHHASPALAFTLDVGSWVTGRGTTGSAATMLSQHGWRTAALGPGDRIDSAWEDLGHTHAARIPHLTPEVS